MVKQMKLLPLVALATSLFAAAPLPDSPNYLGLYERIQVGSNFGDPVLNGGAFTGGVYSNRSGSLFSTTFWCVDSQLYFNPTQAGDANIIRLDQVGVGAFNNKTRYEDINNTSDPQWSNTSGGSNVALQNNFAYFNTALQRYRAAAWLITQYNFATAGNAQSGISDSGAGNAAKNDTIQRAIWSLIHNTSGTKDSDGFVYAAASNSIRSAVNGWLDLARANYLNVDLTKWAVVSWQVDAQGNVLGTNGNEGNPTTDRQTFLVQVVPEPGFYGVMAAGFAGLVLALKRRRTQVV